MSIADPKMFAAVKSFLDRQRLEYSETDEQHCTKLEVRRGAQKAFVNVFHTGTISIQGRDSPLKTSLEQMKEALEAGEAVPGQALPFEIDKFPDTIREHIPDCDPVITRFVEEAIRCVRAEALLAAAFMTGAASEKAINLLIDTYGDSIKNISNKEKFSERIKNKTISKKYKDFLASYKSCKSKPTDPRLSQDLEDIIGGMFQFCRITRNEIGHPEVVPNLDRGVLLANLSHFVTYIERIYMLINYFKANGVEV